VQDTYQAIAHKKFVQALMRLVGVLEGYLNLRGYLEGHAVSRVNQGGKRDNQDGKFFEGAISEAFSSDLTALEAI
jgi:hypothetical protein